MSYIRFTHLSCFYWDSPLSEERQLEILNFLSTLTNDQRTMIEELFTEVELEISFNNAEGNQ